MKLFRRNFLKAITPLPFSFGLAGLAGMSEHRARADTGSGESSAKVETKPFIYEGPGGTFEGTISWDSAVQGRRPAVLIAHAFGGQGAFDTAKAEELARMGYVGIAIDVYGQGIRASGSDEAWVLMGALDKDRALLRDRLLASLDAAIEHPMVDQQRIAAIGFCFGGKCVLDLARSGANVRGVASFHGLYDSPAGLSEPEIGSKILVFHGWDDPLAPPQSVQDLATELTRRGADWQVHAFGDTAHSFTNPRAQAPEQGTVYNALSDRRAWAHLSQYLRELFDGSTSAA